MIIDKPKILIVDDREENLIALEKILGQLDVIFVRALSGNDALMMIIEYEFALAIVDVQMPDMDGYETVTYIRQEQKAMHLPVIFVSAIYSEEYHHVKGIEAGAVDFLTKPIVPEILKGKVSVFLNLYRQKKELEEKSQQLGIEINERKKMEAYLLEWKTRYEVAVMSSGNILYDWNTENNNVVYSGNIEDVIGYTQQEMRGGLKRWKELIHPDDLDLFNNETKQSIETKEVNLFEYRVRKKDGTYIHVEDKGIFINLSSEKVSNRVIGFVKDITERKANECRINYNYHIQSIINSILRESLNKIPIKDLLGNILDLIFLVPWLSYQSKGSIYLADNNCKVLVLQAQNNFEEELVDACRSVPFGVCLCGKAAISSQIIFADKVDERHEIHHDKMEEHGHYCVPMISSKGLIGVLNLYVPSNHKRTKEEEETLVTIANTIAGIIERKQLEQHLETLAHFDVLTGVPNRIMLFDYLNDIIEQASKVDFKVALMFMDLDHFKKINDTLGHDVGDLLLKSVVVRLKKCIRNSDMLARLGGDEFAVVLTNIVEEKNAANVAQNIIASLSEPFMLNGNKCSIGASIGISIYPNHGEHINELLKKADIAMYYAKHSTRNTFRFYVSEMTEITDNRVALENDLGKAIEENELTLNYQPIIDLKTGKIIALEALLRWHRHGNEFVSPSEFIGIAEDSGLILPIGQWVIETACKQRKIWQDMGFPPFRVSINMSVCQIFQQINLTEMVTQTLLKEKLDTDLLEIEITETVCMQNVELVTSILYEFSKMGISMSLDDFGTGYSSLSYLKLLSINNLKIDRSFIKDIISSKCDVSIVRATINMAHSLGLKVIAEGVETIEQFKVLHKLNCDFAQGYLFSKPVPAKTIEHNFKTIEDTIEKTFLPKKTL